MKSRIWLDPTYILYPTRPSSLVFYSHIRRRADAGKLLQFCFTITFIWLRVIEEPCDFFRSSSNEYLIFFDFFAWHNAKTHNKFKMRIRNAFVRYDTPHCHTSIRIPIFLFFYIECTYSFDSSAICPNGRRTRKLL